MRAIPLIAVVLLVLGGCRSDDGAALAKCDAPLRQKLEELSRTGRQETLGVLGKCRSPIDDAMRQGIANTGATLLSVNDDLFTARAPSDRLLELAKLEFVTQLQLAQTAEPSSP